MNISRSADAIEIRVPSIVARAGMLALAAGRRAAGAIAAASNRPKARPFGRVPLDRRTLRDIGLTPTGISEEALAALNEAGGRGGDRS